MIDIRVLVAASALLITLLCAAFIAGVNVAESLVLRGKLF